jgi:hypothetical protein
MVALGFVRDALRDMEMIQAAGVAGLEPTLELLGTVSADCEERR